MNENIAQVALQLDRTPRVLAAFLAGLPTELLHANEGRDTWSAHEVLAHLILCERINFWPRIAQLLLADDEPTFGTMDMEAHNAIAAQHDTAGLLSIFDNERRANLQRLEDAHLSEADLDRKGIHPKLGPVTLSQVLHTWVAHDLTHIGQITRVLAKHFKEGIGPFSFFLPRLQ